MQIKDTKAIQTSVVHPKDLNSRGTMFGGEIFSLIDLTCSISVTRFCHQKTFTVAINNLEYYQPLLPSQIVEVESYVCGCGTTSIETIAFVYGENENGERFLATTCLMTYALPKNIICEFPHLEASDSFEKYLLKTYNRRKDLNKSYHQYLKEVNDYKESNYE